MRTVCNVFLYSQYNQGVASTKHTKLFSNSPPSVGLTGPAQTTTRGSECGTGFNKGREAEDGEIEREKRRINQLHDTRVLVNV